MPTDNYFKCVESNRIQTITVPVEVPDEEGSMERRIVAPGFIKRQEFFPFDSRNPDSVKKAWNEVQAYRDFHGRKGKLSRYAGIPFAGTWDALPYVGQGFGEAN